MLISLLPPLLILLIVNYFSSKDLDCKFNTIKCLIVGTFIVLPIAILETMVMPTGLSTSLTGIFISNFLVIAPIEEIGKLLIVYFTIKYANNSENIKPINIIVCSIAGAMGFAMIENIVYVADGGLNTAILRAITSIPMHASTSIIIGFYGSKEVQEQDLNGWVKGYLIGILMHGFYNTYTMYFNNSFLFIGIFVIVIFYIYLSSIIIKRSLKQIY